ncbi:hypothetical protein RhiXN_08887 [Rhizoctonia solani]|uniref:Uncharacterized protein n=1 Tax=Rhizoctonia solani TaxID=456999 RepID=A0A8H8NWA9_9AGAM|nr:uncharacterized protein RhiXN_08887 [Rhizoctonia solani]QRW19912.1 hypothetical protein RhiXN_08887 [Rhizoctonia solani]
MRNFFALFTGFVLLMPAIIASPVSFTGGKGPGDGNRVAEAPASVVVAMNADLEVTAPLGLSILTTASRFQLAASASLAIPAIRSILGTQAIPTNPKNPSILSILSTPVTLVIPVIQAIPNILAIPETRRPQKIEFLGNHKSRKSVLCKNSR